MLSKHFPEGRSIFLVPSSSVMGTTVPLPLPTFLTCYRKAGAEAQAALSEVWKWGSEGLKAGKDVSSLLPSL